ncbi:phage integrase N-terminal domain-containing protein [Burkholderia sp. LMG 32019]
MTATSLKGKHVDARINQWRAENLSAGTLKNRSAPLC